MLSSFKLSWIGEHLSQEIIFACSKHYRNAAEIVVPGGDINGRLQSSDDIVGGGGDGLWLGGEYIDVDCIMMVFSVWW
jgi:hypothetical protein